MEQGIKFHMYNIVRIFIIVEGPTKNVILESLDGEPCVAGPSNFPEDLPQNLPLELPQPNSNLCETSSPSKATSEATPLR